MRRAGRIVIAALALLASAVAAHAQPATSVEDLAAAVVRVKAFIDPDGRTVANLGWSARARASSSARTGWC